MKNNRHKLLVLITVMLVACLTATVFGIATAAASSEPITSAELTAGRTFTDGEGIQLGKNLNEMPRTYEAVVYVPQDVTQKGAIISNYYPLGDTPHIDFSIGIGGTNSEARPMLDITDTNNNRTRVEFRQDIRGDEWIHVVITHESNPSGDVYACYINGEAVSGCNISYWVDGTKDSEANIAYGELDMSKMEQSSSLYLGQAYAYSSATELGAADSYNDGAEYEPTNFKGRIKNVALYSEVLSAEEITASYESGIDTESESIILCYDLTSTETSGETVSGYITDASGNGYDTVPLYHERTEALDSEDYDYSFAIVGDTQFLVDWDLRNDTSYTSDIYDWIIANKDAKKIARVLGVGDIVESGRLDSGVTDETQRAYAQQQWEYAVEQFAKLEKASIPYTITWGYNHDGYEGEEFTTYFANRANFTSSDIGYYFGDSESADYSKRLANYYQRFEVSGVKYMVMCIEYRPDDAVLSWADTVIKANTDSRVIINTHYFLDQWGNISQEYDEIQKKWDTLANENENVEMILCGHIARQNNIVRAYTVAKSGQTVAQFLIDPQQMDRFYGYGDTGVVAMFYFSNGGEDVRVEFISTSKTMRALEQDSEAQDILYGHKNTFEFNSLGEKAPAGSHGEIDIYIIAGQSNAVGYGRGELSVDDDRFTDGFENVLYFGDHEYYGNQDIDGFIPVKIGLGQGNNRSGAEIGIAYKLDGNGRTTVVIKCAQGGTPIYPIEDNTTLEKYGSWTPPSFIEKYPDLVTHEMVGYLYTRLINTLTEGIGSLENDGYIPKIKGILWMQGEAETSRDYAAEAYAELLSGLIGDLRGDLTEISGSDCSATPFVIGKIKSNHINVPAYVDTVNAAQTEVADTLAKVYVLDTAGLEQQDSWHYVAESQRIIGEKFVDTVASANGIYTTPYGNIPENDYSPASKPLAVFSEGEYLSSFDSFANALAYIKDTVGLSGAAASKTAELVLLADHTASTYWNTSQMGGTLVIDLNGYTLSGADSAVIINGAGKPYTSGKMCDTAVIFKNGYISVMGKSICDFSVPSNSAGEKTFSVTFENIGFSFREGATVKNLTVGVATSAGSYNMKVDITFNGCTFDLSANAPSSAKLFSLGNSEIVSTVKINGGKIIKATCESGSLYSVDASDTVTFGKYNGKYTELELPTGVTPAAEQFVGYNGYSGKLMFAKSATLTDTDVYTLTEITTKYGDIPTAYLSTEAYPFVVFVFKGDTLDEETSIKGFASLHGNNLAIDYAKNALRNNVYDEDGYDGQYSAVILMRRDYTIGASEAYYNHGQIRGVVTYDLGGYTLSQSSESDAKSILYVQTKPYTNYDVNEISPSFIEIINGSMVTYSQPIMDLRSTASTNENYTISDKVFGITFKNVSFSLGETATVTSLMLTYSSSLSGTTQDPNPMANYDISFEDCHIDLFQNVKTGSFTLFNLSPTVKNAVSVDVKFYGGTLRGREWDGSGSGCNIKVTRTEATNSSTFSFEKSKTTGDYFNLLLTPGADVPSTDNVFYTSLGKELTFALADSTGISSVYELGESTVTEYGNIPYYAGSAEDYPFALFVYAQGSDTADYIGVYAELLGNTDGVFNVAKNSLKENEWNDGYEGQILAVIVQRRDYTLKESESNSNFAQIRGEIIYDLCGYTLSQYSSSSANALFGITSKPWGTDGTADGHADVFPSTITIENGTILTYNDAIFKLGINTSATSEESLLNKHFTVNLNRLTLGLKEGATTGALLFSYGNARTTGSQTHDKDIAPFYFNISDCVIDLSTVPASGAISIFDVSSEYLKNGSTLTNYISNTVTVCGGEIRASDVSSVTLVSDVVSSGSSVTFVKSANTNYTALTLPAQQSAPDGEFNGLVFVRIYADSETVTYRLTPRAAAELNFVPRSSITLDSALIFNFYIPENESLSGFTLDGITYTVGELTAQGGYYLFSITLDSKEAARNIILTCTFDGVGTATYTFSTLKYAQKLLASSSNQTEKTLVCDILAYIRSAYEYFAEGEDEINEAIAVGEAIDAIIGEGASNAVPADDASSTLTTPDGATFILTSTPAIRFYFSSETERDAHTYKINDKTVEFTPAEDGNYACADVSLYAYMMSESVEVYKNGVFVGEWSIDCYYTYAKTLESNAKLLNIVESFYAYCVSAKAYRNEVKAGQ